MAKHVLLLPCEDDDSNDVPAQNCTILHTKSVELARSPKHKSWLLPKSHQPYTKIAKPHKPKPSRLLPKSQPYTKIAKPSKTQTTPRLQNPKKVAKLDNIHPQGKLMLQNTTKSSKNLRQINTHQNYKN
jgi:hypothetical protein